jgi:alpha-beta hydrolase superfamily lysophospholipase
VSDTGSTHPIYLRDGAGPVFGFFHAPAQSSAAAKAVLICPPFGWDEICSYRSRRDWARQLAHAGFPTLRIDLPGTGDSGGSPRDPEQLAAWTAAVGEAAERLRALSGSDRVAAIGIGLGGLVLCKAIAEDAPIDEVVLWAVPSRGRVLVRELRVFASLEDSALGAVADRELGPAPLPDGYVWAGGFVLTPETAGELDRLDVCALPLPKGRPGRALLLDRDGVSVDAPLQAHLEGNGASVTVEPGKGYGAMMAQPHQALPPHAVFERVSAWLREGTAAEPARAAIQAPTASASGLHESVLPEDGLHEGDEEGIELSVDDVRIRETPIAVPHPRAQLFGVLTEPVDAPPAPLAAVLLNAGAIRRIGPNRMWVEAARRWAALGVSTLRLDLEGIGDAEGDPERLTDLAELYTQELVDQVCAALDALERRGVGRRFVLGGLCSGAYWSFHAALRDERVVAALMLNPQALFWDESLEASRALRRGVLRTSSWRKLLHGQVPLERLRDLVRRAPLALPRRALARRAARRRGENELEAALDRLRDTGKVLRFVFSGNEPLCEELELEGFLDRLERWPNMSVEFIPGRIHTLRPLQAQQGAHEALDRALSDMLERAGHTPLNVSHTSGS